MSEQIEVNTSGQDRYKKLTELVKRTHKENPKPEDVQALRRYFDEDPNLWRATGDMAKRTADHLLRTYYPQSAYVQQCVSRRVQEMREELGYRESSALEENLDRTNSYLLGQSVCPRN